MSAGPKLARYSCALMAGLGILLSGACKAADAEAKPIPDARPATPTDLGFVDSVLEAVYRVQIADFVQHQSPVPEVFVAAVGGGDPSDAVVGRLQGIGAQVRKANAASRNGNDAVRNPESGARGVVLTVSDYRWLDDGSLYVESELKAGPGGIPDQESAFVLTKNAGGWSVQWLWAGENASTR